MEGHRLQHPRWHWAEAALHTHRRIQKCHSVNKYITACIMSTCNKKKAIGMFFNIFQWSFWEMSHYSSMKLSAGVVCFPALQTLCSHWPSVAVRHQCPYPGNVQPEDPSRMSNQIVLVVVQFLDICTYYKEHRLFKNVPFLYSNYPIL